MKYQLVTSNNDTELSYKIMDIFYKKMKDNTHYNISGCCHMGVANQSPLVLGRVTISISERLCHFQILVTIHQPLISPRKGKGQRVIID